MNTFTLHLAVCATALSTPEREIRLFPSGTFAAVDGRPGNIEGVKVTSWLMDARAAAQVIKGFKAKGIDLVIDYEHQTLYSAENGMPAPAAGWIKDLIWREGEGLYGIVEWTDKAAAMIRAKEYRFISPTFYFDEKTGAVTGLSCAGLTNKPALSELGEVLAKFSHPSEEEPEAVSLSEIAKKLGLPEAATAQQIMDAIQASTQNHQAATARAEKAEQDLVAAKAQPQPSPQQAAQTQDPEVWAPVDAIKDMQSQLVGLRNEINARDVGELVQAGLKDGRILPAMEKWARDLGSQNVVALREYLRTASPVAALTGTQTGGHPPVAAGQTLLSDVELAVCKQMGIEPAEYMATQKGGA